MTWTDGEADSPGEPTSHPELAPDTPITLAPATPADEQEARGLRDRGFDLVLHGRHSEAVAPLRAALAWYTQVLNGAPDGHRTASDGISAINITTRLAACAIRLRDEELLLGALTTALKLRAHLTADPNLTGLALEGAVQLADWLDTWRWLLAEDAERVLAQEAAAPLVRELASLLMRAGDPTAALVVSEHARARSLVDLLSARAVSGTVRALADPELGHALAGPTDIQAIQHVVDEHRSAILEYFEGDDGLYGWLLRPGQPVHAFTAPAPAAEVMRDAERLARGLAIPAGDLADDVADLLEGLHAVLLSPIRYLLPVDLPLVVVPSGALSMIPFEALGPRDGPALVEEISVAYAPSAMALGRLDGTAPRPTGGLLALATDEAAALIAGPDLVDDAVGHLLEGLAALGPARGYRGQDATSARLAEQAGTARIVVLLAHGQAMPDPADSYLQLAPADDDGRLTAREVAALTVPAELVILAACETGAGRIAAEGVLGLARGFLWAGVRSVVASRWTVPAETTLDLVYTLVEGEAAGLTPGAAFTAAQRRLRWLYPAQPAVWAAFQLIGP
jgi:CHAT domain-containing protein